MNIKRLIGICLKKSSSLQIATSVNQTPWVCTVCFAYDSEFNLYWFSRHAARHSQEIIRNPHVAGAISLPYVAGNKPRGLQFSGIACELQDETSISFGLEVMCKRYDVKQKRVHELKEQLLSKSADFGLYRLHPDSIVLYDTLTFPNSPRHVYEIVNGVSNA